LERALKMPLKERQRRWRAMMGVLENHDINTWRNGFLAALVDDTAA